LPQMPSPWPNEAMAPLPNPNSQGYGGWLEFRRHCYGHGLMLLWATPHLIYPTARALGAGADFDASMAACRSGWSCQVCSPLLLFLFAIFALLSGNPSVSAAPSSQPSMSTTATGVPSSQLSKSLSVSSAPSSQPSAHPSVSGQPSSQPSTGPSVSASPT